jgi:hypothetical protein
VSRQFRRLQRIPLKTTAQRSVPADAQITLELDEEPTYR